MRKLPTHLLAAVSVVALAGCAADPAESPSGATSQPASSPATAEGTSTPVAPSETGTDAPIQPGMPDSVPPPPAPGTTSADPGPTTTPSFETSPPPNGGWTQMDVEVLDETMTGRLEDTSPEFRAFISRLVSSEDSSGCRSQITVKAFHPDGFASGLDFAPGCGGQTSIWGVVDGEWSTLLSMQALIPCEQIEFNRIPTRHPQLQCLDPAGSVVNY